MAGSADQTEVVTGVITVAGGGDLPNTGGNTEAYLLLASCCSAPQPSSPWVAASCSECERTRFGPSARLAARTATRLGVLCALGALGVLCSPPGSSGYRPQGSGGATGAPDCVRVRRGFDDHLQCTVRSGRRCGGCRTRPARRYLCRAGPRSLSGGRRCPARLEIPAIELDKFVMRDVDRESLQVGPAITAAHHDPVSPATAPSQVIARPMERRSNGSTSCAR